MKFQYLALWVLTFGMLTVQAEDLIYHHMDSEKQNTLTLFNKSLESQDFWILLYKDQYLEEHYFEVSAQSRLYVDVRSFKGPNMDWAVLTKSADVLLPPGWSLERGTRYNLKRASESSDATVRVLNLFPKTQEVHVHYYNTLNQLMHTETYHSSTYLKSSSLSLNWPAGSYRAEVRTDSSIMLQANIPYDVLTDTSRTSDSSRAYFLVGDSQGGSFIAPMEDPDLIAKARAEILNPQGHILFADIDMNSTDPNRNMNSNTKAYWSWKVKKVTGLSQIGADWCHAYPEYIERMLHFWVRQEKACFRGQRILKELSPEEVQTGQLEKLK